MSGSKLLRLCSLFLCLLLFLANFSVTANATEAEENLVDSDIRNWEEVSDLNSQYTPFALLDLETIYGIRVYRIGWKKPSSESVLTSHAIFTIPNLYVGDNYTLKFRVNVLDINSLTKASWHIGIGYIDPSTNEPVSPEGSYITLTEENMSGAIGNSYDESSYKEIVLNFTHKETLGQPCIFIQGTLLDNKDSSAWIALRILENSFILTRDVNETDNKLDGILGWLEDIKNLIISLPETIKTNFQIFFSDLQGKITDLKDGVTEKLGTISTEFSGYITNLGDRVSGFFTDLSDNVKSFFDDIWEKFSNWFDKFKPRIDVKENIENIEIQHNSYVWFEYTVPEGCVFTLDYFGKSSDSDYIRIGDYYGFASNTATHYLYSGDSIELTPGKYYFHWVSSYGSGFNSNNYLDSFDIYCDSGWFSYFSYNLKKNLNSIKEDIKLKIDLKIEEMKTAIHDFFVPPEGFFEEWKVTFDLMLSDNLGFIYQAPNFVIDIVEVIQEILQSDQEVNLVFPAVEFDIAGYHIELFKDTKVDFSFLEAGIWLTLYSMYKVMLYVIFALALIKYGMSTWERTMAN